MDTMDTFMEYVKRGTKQVEKGIEKYGGTLDEKDLSAVELIDHAVEEHIDAIFYMLKLREKLDDRSAPSEVKEQTSRSCHDCKHLGTSIRTEPCVICQNKRNWQPRKEGSE